MSIAALPYVNWIFWTALTAGTLLVVGGTEVLGGTTRGYRLFMAGFAVACVAILVLSELNLPAGVPAARTADLRRPLVMGMALGTLAYLTASVLRWPAAWMALAAGCLGVAGLVVLAGAGGTSSAGVFAVQLLLLTLALGSVNAAMLLGHWYLVTPRLSPAPLQRMILLLVAALTVQAAVVLVAVLGAPRDALAGGIGWLTWLRLLVGTLLPIAIAVLAMAASRAASLQASTGLLYIGLALVIAGSIAGPSITYLTGITV